MMVSLNWSREMFGLTLFIESSAQKNCICNGKNNNYWLFLVHM
jgi:hypothetical protein